MCVLSSLHLTSTEFTEFTEPCLTVLNKNKDDYQTSFPGQAISISDTFNLK